MLLSGFKDAMVSQPETGNSSPQVVDPDAVARVSVAGGAADMGLAPVGRDQVELPRRRVHGHDTPRPQGDPHQRVRRQHEDAAELPTHGRSHHLVQGGRPLRGASPPELFVNVPGANGAVIDCLQFPRTMMLVI